VGEHGQMIEALSQRDGAALKAVLVQHLHHKRDVVIEQIRIESSNKAMAKA
jgi:DNA-binding GntR family transcriptional regulator